MNALWCAVWELTLACDLSCAHCGSSAGKKREGELSTEEALALCDDLKTAGARGVALMGGEPLLRPDWRKIALRAKQNGIEVSLITNGFSATQSDADFLKEIKPRAVAVSLDAADACLHDEIRGRTGAWRKAWDFLNLCLSKGLPASVITTVHKKNLGELAGLRDILRGKNLAWQIQTAGAEGQRFPRSLMLDAEEFYSVGLFISAVKKTHSSKELAVIGAHDLGYHSYLLGGLSLGDWRGCQAGISVAGIQSDGGVKGCLAMTSEPPEGNIRQKPFSKIWADPGAFAFNRKFDAFDLGAGCLDCEFRSSCRGGCNEMSLTLCGKKHADPYCFFRLEKEFFSGELKNPARRAFWELRRFLGESAGAGQSLVSRFSGKI